MSQSEVNEGAEMPDPLTLRIGDRVRFVSIPEAWSVPGYYVHRDSIALMKRLIRRRFPSRVARFDEFGFPWIHARIKSGSRIVYHYWLITELTGWRKVESRDQPDRSVTQK